ncbi:MAG: Flagellar export protein FliJ [Thermoleophilia bacterium]|nr:Flagellar export protein FliJ [Thermoleophilia bacterium]
MRSCRSGDVKRDTGPTDARLYMKRFHFTLESVRHLRQQQEEVVQVELARAVRERAIVVKQIEVSRAAEAALYDYLREPGRTAAEMAHVANFGALHRQQLYKLGINLRQFDQGVELIRTRLVTARAKREALDRLRERQYDAWRAEMLRSEQAELDEIATMRATRLLREENGRAGVAA